MTRDRASSKQTLRLIAVLAEATEDWMHGYFLSKQSGLKSGTLYPIMMRLEERGLLESRWQQSPHPGRPARRMCRLTVKGRAFANEELSNDGRLHERPPRLVTT